MSPTDELYFENSLLCHIFWKNRECDHCHFTGAFRGAANQACNINYEFKNENERKRNSFFIPIVLHNLRNYDASLILSAVGNIKGKRLSCVPNNMEKYISSSVGNLRFIDSFQFANTSLDNLVENLKKYGKEKFQILMRYGKDNDKQNLLLLWIVNRYWHAFNDRVWNSRLAYLC